MLVDVALNYYGKPYQTMLTIESLLDHSAEHIDRVYLIIERCQPRDDESLEPLLDRYADRLVCFTPRYYLAWASAGYARLRLDRHMRQAVRYQFALESTDKDYLFMSHNDIVYHADLVGEFKRVLGSTGAAGAGLVGQCWNCFAQAAGYCDSSRYAGVRLSYEEAERLNALHPSPRHNPPAIDRKHPQPLPECRLNEFACMLDTAIYRRECMPKGSILPFGAYDRGIDMGSGWFRSMRLRGYAIANVNIWDYCEHGVGMGHPDLFDEDRYAAKEQAARQLLVQRGVLGEAV